MPFAVAADGSCIFHSVSVEDSERGESAWNGIGVRHRAWCNGAGGRWSGPMAMGI